MGLEQRQRRSSSSDDHCIQGVDNNSNMHLVERKPSLPQSIWRAWPWIIDEDTQKTLTLATHVMLWHLCSDTHQTKSLHQPTEDNCASLSVQWCSSGRIISTPRLLHIGGRLKYWIWGCFKITCLGIYSMYEAPKNSILNGGAFVGRYQKEWDITHVICLQSPIACC